MAVLVLAAQGISECQFDEFIFANVGSDSENPETLKYFDEIAKPFADEHELKLVTVERTRRGEPLTLRQFLMEDNHSVGIPVRLATGAPGNRVCTVDFKIRVISRYILREKEIRQQRIGLGISTNEIGRVRNGNSEINNCIQQLEYPLIDLRMSLNDCIATIQEAGLPPPPKSACYFCPYHRPVYWSELRQDHPDLFADAVAIEKRLNEKRKDFTEGHNDPVYLHPRLIPLDQAVGEQYNFFDELENCESGFCMT